MVIEILKKHIKNEIWLLEYYEICRLVRELNTVQLSSHNPLPSSQLQLFADVSQLLYMPSIKSIKETCVFYFFFFSGKKAKI